MTRAEKISVARIVSDLIKADSVIDSREMSLLEEVKRKYNLSKEHFNDARSISFSCAVNNLECLTNGEKAEMIKIFKNITLADGMCNKDEALLMTALIYCLEEEFETEMLHVKIPQQGLQLENSQVVYVESKYDDRINHVIQENYHQIENAMRLAGFDFAYIPKIAETYRETNTELFSKVMTFLTPNLENSELKEIKEKISSMTTLSFCKEQLHKKLHIYCMADTRPSLLMKVGETISDNDIFANFLKIEIGDDILSEIKQFMYGFTSMMNSEYSILRNIFNSKDRFVYSGVYKQIIDLCLMKDNNKSIVLLDTIDQKIKFPDINEELGVHRAEKALYVLLLSESIISGLNFNQPVNIQQKKKYEERAERIMRKYKKIYHMFGGNQDNAPDIMDPTIRNPKIAKINKYIDKLERKLSSPEDYKIRRTNDGLYKINLESNMIYSRGKNSENCKCENLPWIQSERWQIVLSM
jgi:hypothetical protein